MNPLNHGSLIISTATIWALGFVTCVPPAALLTGLSNGRSVFTIKPIGALFESAENAFIAHSDDTPESSVGAALGLGEGTGVGLALCSGVSSSRLKVNVNSLPDPELLALKLVTNCGLICSATV